MADVIYLSLIAAFFVLAVAFVKACEAIVGPEELAAPGGVNEPEPESLAA